MSLAIDTETGSVTAGKWLLPRRYLGWAFSLETSRREGSFVLGWLVTHPPSVPAMPVAGVRLSMPLPWIKVLWSAFCEHQQPPFSLLPSSSPLNCKLLLYLSPSCPSSLQRTLYLYLPGSQAVYIIAVYNRLIHLWPSHFTLIKLL